RALPICLLTFTLAHAPSARAELWADHLKPTLEDGFDTYGMFYLLAGVAAVGFAQSKDYEMRAAFSNHQRMSNGTSRFGDFLGTGIPGALVAVTQLIWDNNNGIAHAEALIDTAIVTAALKQGFARARPNSENHHAMPSGHTSTTFTSATSLTYAYGWRAAIPAYALAVLTGVSRMSDDAHWFSDTVAGATIGFFWGRATYQHHKPERLYERANAVRMRSYPMVSSRFLGAGLAIEF
ncbi:MAG TPA: phosphatase PAP2 family protein, partial [Bdellovibrionales bacterium]|nr:phosphatase PAP2 family protein [Bdellovibrionales bacterium]